MYKLSIIIPFLNEGEEPINTIKSINETTSDVEIIVIDDASTDEQDLNRFDKFNNVKYFRNETRQGTGYSIQFGINKVTSDYILIIDAHMRFYDDGWSDKIVKELEKDDKLLLSTISVALNYDNKDKWDKNKIFDKDEGHHNGANLIPLYTTSNNEKILFDPRWKELEYDKGYIYDIPCIMGANYASSKKWLKYIKSTEGLRHWGSIEETLSLKTWLSGGSVKLLTTVGIAHVYRSVSVPYNTNFDYVMFNKLWIAYTLFDDKTTSKLFNFVKDDPRYIVPLKILNDNINEANEYKKYFNEIFIRDISFLENVNINFNDNLFKEMDELKNDLINVNDKLDMHKESLKKLYEVIEKTKNDKNLNRDEKENIIRITEDVEVKKIEEKIENTEKLLKELNDKYIDIKPSYSVFGYD